MERILGECNVPVCRPKKYRGLSCNMAYATVENPIHCVTYIATLKHNDQSTWKLIKSRKRPLLHLPPTRKNGTPPGPWAQSDAEKVELFARHLAEVFSPHDKALDQEIENNLAANSTDSEKLSAFTTNDLINVLNKLHPLKAPRHDCITALIIQKLPPKGIQTLMHIYNSIIRLNYWPVTLKEAKVIMVPNKGKDPNKVSSYRPISLLPVLSKILEKLILIKLTNEPNSMNWIPWHQFGFRSHSTIQQCHRLVDTINKALEEKITAQRYF
jgi:hypothetical protein